MVEAQLQLAARGPERKTVAVRIDDESLATFTSAERHALIDALAQKQVLGSDAADPPVAEPSVDSVRRVLAARLAATTRKPDKPPRILEDEAGRAALARWVAKHGTPSMIARLRENLLPAQEILTALRRALFEKLDGEFTRFEAMTPAQVCSWKRVRCARCTGRVEFESRKCENGIVAEQFAELQRIRKAAPQDATVELWEHIGWCSGCTCRERKVGAKVVRRWEGFELVREYALVGPKPRAAQAR
jgi:hypothetical protein